MGEMTAAEGGQHRLRKHENNIAGLYDLEETLGSGHFATVKLAKHVFTGEKVAVKVIDKAKLDKMSRNHIYQEVRCMKLVQHPNVIRLYQVIETNSRLCLIMELGGCDLLDYINKNEQGLPENEAKNYFSQIVCAISYCHKLHVVHRDLKPENVVFFENEKTVKITDFGFSNRFNPGQKLETSCGSLAYSAPEILLGDSYDAPAVDIWSLGVILFMLVSGYPPFHEANDSETLTMIMDCKYNIPSHVTPNCKELIQRMIVKDPEKRTTLEQITASQWMNNITMDHNDKPLVSFQGILEDDHKSIVNKMVDGGVAEKDVILRTLEDNEYNHITATYYLLAESIMRNKRKLCESANKGVPPSNYRASGKTQERCITANFLTTSHLINDKQQKTRKCSIVQEEEDRVDVNDPESYYQVERRSSRSESQLHQLLVAATISNNKNTSNETISKGHICLKKE